MHMTIGDRIKQYRLERGWSQEELAKKMGYTNKSTICLVEKGRSDLTTSSIIKYADVFGVAPSEIMGWGKPLTDEEYTEIEEVCADEGMKVRLMAYVRKLKEIKDAENA